MDLHVDCDQVQVKPTAIFLSGKMTGEPEYNFPLFNSVADFLRKHDYYVLNPAELPVHEEWTWGDYIRRSLRMMLQADVIVLLPNFYNSKGARVELEVAGLVGMKILSLDDILDQILNKDGK